MWYPTMLRITVSKVKKVCSVALVPRILRGDLCGVPVSNAVVRKALGSTKSTDDGNQYMLGSEDNVEKKSDEATSLDKTLTETSQPLLSPSIPLTQRERCQKIIDKAFGNCEHTTESDPEVGEQYFSHSVNLKEARREILEAEERLKVEEELHKPNPLRHDSRTQYGIFNMPHNLDDHDEMLHKVSISEAHPTTRDPNLDKDVENYVKDPESLENDDALTHSLRDDDAKTIEMGKDEGRKYVYREAISQEQIQTLLPYSKTQFGVYSLTRDNDSFAPEILTEPTLEIVGESEDLDKTFVTNANEDVEKCVKNLESVENKKLADSDLIKHMFINATTAKDDEDQLLQKLETIEETPLVEAQKPKLDGFNVTPKVLGDKSVLSSKSIEYNKGNLPGNLDDVAKRCLNSPLGQIDEILLNEMEKLPCTRKTESKASLKTQLQNILVQINELKEHPNTGGIGQQEILSKNRKFKDEKEEKVRSEILCITGLMNATRHYTALPDLNKQAEEDGQPARETVEVIKHKIENACPLKNTKSNEAIVTDKHVITGVESTQESKGTASIVNNLSRNAQNPQWPSAGETEKCFSKVASYKGVHRPSYETVNASNYAMHGQQKTARNSLHSRNSYNGPDMCGHKQQNAIASETEYLLHKGETDRIERQGQTPQGQTTEEEGVVHKPNTANKKCESVPLANLYLPEHKLNKQTANLPKGDKATLLCTQEKSYLTEPRQKYRKGSLSDEMLKEHELDPGSDMGGHKQQNDFASETDYLLQNGETNRIERQGQTPQDQSTEEEGVVHKPNTANKRCERVPLTNFRLPEHKWNKQTEHLPKGDKALPLCTPEKLYLTEPRQEYRKGSLSDEMLKEHEVDPVPDMWGHKQQNAFASETDYLLQKGATDRIERQGQKPQGQSPEEEGVVHKPNTANKKCERVPLANFRLPEQKLNKQTEHLPKRDKATQLCTPEKLYLTEPRQEYRKDSLSDEMLKEHELDPGPDMWGHKQQNAFASETDYLLQRGETDRIERQGLTPPDQSTEEEGVVHKPNTANKKCERGPNANLYLPENKWNIQTEHLSKGDKATPLCTPAKSFLTEPRQEYRNGSLSDELFKEHELDPYYVLACNETCPIAPVSTISTLKNSDFVDSTESLRMMKNNQESRQHKPLPRDVMITEENVSQDTQVLHELDGKDEPGYTDMPGFESKGTRDIIQNLPRLSDNVSLSELLRRVRQRNRLECIGDLKAMGLTVSPTVGVGKCPRPAPKCPPTAPRSPPNNPVPPPTFGLPMLKGRPPVCKPIRKKPGCKCTACDTDVSCGVQIGEICPEMAYELSEAEVCALTSKPDWTKVIADRLQTLGIVLNGALRQVKSSTEMLFAREYDPWAPIPSWPLPTKAGNPCDKKCKPTPPCNLGCPLSPKVRASMKTDPPCDLKPCKGFPKRTYSMLDYFAVSLGGTKVNDLGHF